MKYDALLKLAEQQAHTSSTKIRATMWQLINALRKEHAEHLLTKMEWFGEQAGPPAAPSVTAGGGVDVAGYYSTMGLSTLEALSRELVDEGMMEPHHHPAVAGSWFRFSKQGVRLMQEGVPDVTR